ncbi:MAG TPA: GTPase HflX [Parachlamydiales bacterium]|nr:GTPase HflX [Parachlamydiales bacterium]
MEPGQGRLVDLLPEQKKTLLVGTYKQTSDKELCAEQLSELESLCVTYGLETVEKIMCPIKAYDASTFVGKGKVQEIAALVLEKKIDVVIFDDEISPQQQRNLEKIFEKISVDRTELILGVFAQRAHSREARIQVELATLRYQMPRLRRMWTHLSRQRSGGSSGGGGGYVRGEGEKQIEIDRRIVRRRLDRLEVELKAVKQARDTQRQARKRSGIATFAIVGYTNVGKSTLMHALTDADVLVEDKLFATLDTTTRKYVLPNRQEILLIDTVGFIRKIPHLLVAAFKSTLEEAVQADILLHLVDVSSPAAETQAESTLAVVKELGAENVPMITVLNKIDQCQNRLMAERMRIKYPKTVEISALQKTGFDHLLELMISEISKLRKHVKLRIPQSHYALVSELMREGKVSSCEYEGNDVVLEVEIPRILEKKVALFEVFS